MKFKRSLIRPIRAACIGTMLMISAIADHAVEGSDLAVLIEARMTDYLERKRDGKLVEGSRKKKDVERVWCFTYENSKWVVSNIDEGSNSFEYIEMMKPVPKIEQALELHGAAMVRDK